VPCGIGRARTGVRRGLASLEHRGREPALALIDPLVIPKPALVLLVGPSGSGKSTFGAEHFKPAEIVSSDSLREMVSDDPSDQNASAEAFKLLALIANGRLRRRLTTVIDATNLRAANRKRLRQVASRYGIPTVAIAFDLPVEVYMEHNRLRRDRMVDAEVVADQAARMTEAMTDLAEERYAAVYIIQDPDLLRSLRVERR
jgi:predicted kinase